jgi:hypothetical protein
VTATLLPADFSTRCTEAVLQFWRSRGAATGQGQGGTRNQVTAGLNMNGFCELVGHVTRHCGFPPEAIHARRRDLILPGYYRATKNWDVLVIHERRLLAVFEFKSQVGSFGNNFNNRSEEAIGSAADLWQAHRHGAYTKPVPVSAAPAAATETLDIAADPRPPFLAWLMLLEESPDSMRPVGVDEPHFAVFLEFRGASYAQRYQLLCERLMQEQLYSAAALVLSNPLAGTETGAHRALSDATSLDSLFRAFAGRLLAAG